MSIHKPIFCNRNCGTEIHFDPAIRSISGKMIPLEMGGNEPHQCDKPKPKSNINANPSPRLSAGSDFSELTHAIERLTTRIEELIQRMDNR